MDKEFEKPDFESKCIEIKFDGEEVSIYASVEGLKKLMGFCETLINTPHKGHIHLEDYEVLTENSLKGTIVIIKPGGLS